MMPGEGGTSLPPRSGAGAPMQSPAMSRAPHRKWGLPAPLLVQIGRVATVSAYVEQELVIWTSALCAQETGGNPIDDLRISFGRLLSRWEGESAKRYDQATMQSLIRPSAETLASLWRARSAIVHGRWEALGSDEFRLAYWEQGKEKGVKKGPAVLRHFSKSYGLSAVEGVADELLSLLGRFYAFHDAAPPEPSRQRSGAPKPHRPSPSNTKRKAPRRPPSPSQG